MSGLDQYGVVGHPVAHSLSPFIHAMFARQTGQSMNYRLFDFAPEEFDRRVEAFFAEGGRGLNITLPFKVAAVARANELTSRAAGARSMRAPSTPWRCARTAACSVITPTASD